MTDANATYFHDPYEQKKGGKRAYDSCCMEEKGETYTRDSWRMNGRWGGNAHDSCCTNGNSGTLTENYSERTEGREHVHSSVHRTNHEP